ncbi:MAG: ribosomal protein S18-alanine N-acetyltransferase [Methanocellales archaeon]|nr:ribosomal protein S18-alanine N-acetyltransferase [Methanocellales archaeon]
MLLIRKFMPRDFQQILSIEEESFREHDPFLYMKLYETSSDGFLVAEKDGIVMGFVVGMLISESEGRIFSIAVSKKHRRSGVATLLVKELLDAFRRNGVTSVRLEVRKSNLIAQKLYQKLGFEMVGVAPKYYSDGESALIMRKIIDR